MKRLALSLALVAACGGPEEAPQAPSPDAVAEAPAVGDRGDSSERACQVILRSVARTTDGSGQIATDCSSGACVHTWAGTVDVAEATAARGGVPAVLVGTRPGVEWVWREVAAAQERGPTDGFVRYRFTFTDGTLARGPSASAIDRFALALAPFVRLPDGSRAFDHNRVPGDLDVYRLERANGWTVGEDAARCAPASTRPQATLHFEAGWRNRQEGAIVAGGRLRVDYDPARLPQCNGSTYNGLPTWSILGYARFLPSGTVVSGPLVGCPEGACAALHRVPFDSDVPAGTTGVELWFMTSGRTCTTTYDSNFGQNHRFDVEATAPGPVGWAGDWGSSFARDCTRRDGVAEPTTVDGYVRERACMMVFADVWAEGVTDTERPHPEWLTAVVEWSLDGRPATTTPLELDGQVGHNLRWRWTLPRQELIYATWSQLQYRFLFSTDGRTFYRAGQDDGSARTIVRGSGF